MAKKVYDDRGAPINADPVFGKQANVRIDDTLRGRLQQVLAEMKRTGIVNPSANDVFYFAVVQYCIFLSSQSQSPSSADPDLVTDATPATESAKAPKRKGGKA